MAGAVAIQVPPSTVSTSSDTTHTSNSSQRRWWDALGDIIDDLAEISRGSLAFSLIESTIFGGTCLAFSLWSLQHSESFPIAFIPLVLHRAFAVVLDLSALFCNLEQTWFGLTTEESFSVKNFLPRFTRLADELGCLMSMLLAVFVFISLQLFSGFAASFKMIAFPLWLGTAVQVTIIFLTIVNYACNANILCSLREESAALRKPVWRFMLWMFAGRLPGILLNTLTLPLAIKLDDPDILTWHSIFAGAITLVMLLALPVFCVLLAAAVQSVTAPQDSKYARKSRRAVVSFTLSSAIVIFALVMFLLVEADAQLSSRQMHPALLVIPFCTLALFITIACWAMCITVLPPWRSEYAAIMGLSTPTTAAERRENYDNTDLPSVISPCSTGTGRPLPKHLYRVSHHVYKRYDSEDGGFIVANTPAPKPEIFSPSRLRSRLAWQSPRHAVSDAASPRSALCSPTRDAMSPDSQRLCRLCYVHDANGVFLECGHGGFCMVCGLKIRFHNDPRQRRCPMCRQHADYLVRILPPHLQRDKIVPVLDDSDEDAAARPSGQRSAARRLAVITQEIV